MAKTRPRRDLTIRALASAADTTKWRVERAIGSMTELRSRLHVLAARDLIAATSGFTDADASDAGVRKNLVDAIVDFLEAEPLWALIAFDTRARQSGSAAIEHRLYSGFGDDPTVAEAVSGYCAAQLYAIAQLHLAGADLALVRSVADITIGGLGELEAVVTSRHAAASPTAMTVKRAIPPTPPPPAGIPGDLFEAAWKLVDERGHQSISIRSLAEVTNYGKSAVQTRIGSRLKLIDALRGAARSWLVAPQQLETEPDEPASSESVVRSILSAPNHARLSTDRGSRWGLIGQGHPEPWQPFHDLERTKASAISADLAANFVRALFDVIIACDDVELGVDILEHGEQLLVSILDQFTAAPKTT